MAVSSEEVYWAYRCLLGREPDSRNIVDAHRLDHADFQSLRLSFITSSEFQTVYRSMMPAPESDTSLPHILIQNYHTPATRALVRDFRKIGMRVLSPDSNWGFSWYSPNRELGSELISYENFLSLPPGRILVACMPQEADMKRIAAKHGDLLILHVAQHHNYYEINISDTLICPDIVTYDNYPDKNITKLMYFSRPFLDFHQEKPIETSYRSKLICTYINRPDFWPVGASALVQFRDACKFKVTDFGQGSSGGSLSHESCNKLMSESFFTVHFKESEAYGLSCLESMLLGTPVVTLRSFMEDKTLGKFFLDDTTAIYADTIDDAVERVHSISQDEYATMSANATQRVLDLTSDKNTVDKLRLLIFR